MPVKTKKPRKDIVNRIFHFIIETGMLMQMPRTHIRQLGNTFDNVASHSHHVAVIAYCLARMEGLSHEEGMKAMVIGVLHDTPEARTGDLDFVAKYYATNNEEKAIEDQLKGLPFAQELKKIYQEYEERATLTAKCAKDADVIDQMYQQWILMHRGNKIAERWQMNNYKTRVPYLRTKSAKKLALAMKANHPHSWFQDYVENKPNQELLNGKK